MANKHSDDKLSGGAAGDQPALLFENMPAGFAWHKLIVDAHNDPVDFTIVSVNTAFERITGLTRESLVGKRASEALPGIDSPDFDWIDAFGRAVFTGETVEFEEYLEPQKRWFQVTAYSIGGGFFATIFTDVTHERRTLEALKRHRTQEGKNPIGAAF